MRDRYRVWRRLLVGVSVAALAFSILAGMARDWHAIGRISFTGFARSPAGVLICFVGGVVCWIGAGYLPYD